MSQESENPVVRAHRDVVERLWTQPVLELCGRELPDTGQGTVLAAEARCGAVVHDWLNRLPEDTRMMVLDPSGVMLDEARSRVTDKQQRRLFFVEERVGALSYADEVFDAAVCLQGLVTTRQAREGLAELRRVVSPQSPVVTCFPLHDSFGEFYDLFDEALRSCGLEDVLARIGEVRSNLLSPARLSTLADDEGLDQLEVTELSWTVAFDGGREFLYSPLVQETFFPHWIGAVRSSEREDVLNHIGRAIDSYWSDRMLETDIKAALVVAVRGEGPD